MSGISVLLRKVLGDDCQDEIDIFKKQKVNCKLFWKLSNQVLLDMGKSHHIYSFQYSFGDVNEGRFLFCVTERFGNYKIFEVGVSQSSKSVREASDETDV